MTHVKKTMLLLLALLAIGGLAACGDDDGATDTAANTATVAERDSNPEQEDTPNIIVRDGKPVDGVRELEWDAGEAIKFRVSSNRAEKVHIHGYDKEKEIPAGGSVKFAFPADIEGIFEVELHGSEAQIAELRVNP